MEQDKYITREEFIKTMKVFKLANEDAIIMAGIAGTLAFTLATESNDLNFLINKLKKIVETGETKLLFTLTTDEQIAKYRELLEVQIKILQQIQNKEMEIFHKDYH
jgi:hypothetical protein